MSDLHYFLLITAYYGALTAFIVAFVLFVSLFLMRLESSAAKNWKLVAGALWTLGAVGVTFLAGDFLWYPDSDEPVRDLGWWADYLARLFLIFAIFFLPAGIYWFRVFLRKPRN